MTQQYAHPERLPRPAQQPAVHDELDQHKQEREAEAAEEQHSREALDAVRNDVATADAAVQDRIDQILSSSPEQFVIRFIQTEGQ